MGISNKINLGFLVVGFVLFLASLVSIFEMGRIRRSVGDVITVNVDNINISSQLLEVTDQNIFALLSQIGITPDSVLQLESIYDDERFDRYLQSTRSTFSTGEEKALTDSIMFAYAAYMQILNEAPALWQESGYLQRREWYSSRLYPTYSRLRKYVQDLISLEQRLLHDNTRLIQDGFYRSMMPGVIAVASSILLLFLLSYFIRIYLIQPIRQIRTGVKNTLLFRKKYQVKLPADDELADLNESVAKLCDEHNKL
ncbi:MAG: MCP four helix bundle domain-containing protein [Bacteroidales bacterium]|jgi:methyl-accepting chemotaxis protein|nr:MCP four helix bundle domain-containing protein [Bacteroidales bacterium]MDD3100110.1 MCP four helix bundle domain-containing protein [Bacteroidales bacterium]MDD3638990.1 MCP four helix bundle domain-containing protein [Bacteroidales bacterium]MDD3943555.1 MCP four helix bundle domain-containing protein [Bacteroidales bacterium]MDD4480284.1 MCP four helix bundle domain-containing protein [Bacteroidales bacterium]